MLLAIGYELLAKMSVKMKVLHAKVSVLPVRVSVLLDKGAAC